MVNQVDSHSLHDSEASASLSTHKLYSSQRININFHFRIFVTGSVKIEHNSAIHVFQYKALKYIG